VVGRVTTMHRLRPATAPGGVRRPVAIMLAACLLLFSLDRCDAACAVDRDAARRWTDRRRLSGGPLRPVPPTTDARRSRITVHIGGRRSSVSTNRSRSPACALVITSNAVVTTRPVVIASSRGELATGRRGWTASCRRSLSTGRLSPLPTAGAIVSAIQQSPESHDPAHVERHSPLKPV
jgi:hypothetical protein